MDDIFLDRVLDAALTLCIHTSRASAEEVADAVKADLRQVADAMAALARRGDLRAMAGGLYAQPLRILPIKGRSLARGIQPKRSQLMGGRS